MKQVLMMLALAGLAVACGDDDNNEPSNNDGGLIDAGSDAGGGGGDAAVAVKVSNVGAACTSDVACTGGSSAICQTTSFTTAANPGGMCTATCTKAAECGPNGTCPTGEAIASFPPALTASLGTVGYCSQSCTAPGTQSTCRTGYTCVTLNLLAQARGQAVTPGIALLAVPFCAALPAATDAGVSDGGVVSDAGGIDSGL